MSHIDKLYIRYPQGCGGRWLSTLLQKIRHGDLACCGQTDHINFHDAHGLNRGHDVRDSHDVVFGGDARFNFFLNFWWKKRVFENFLDFNKLSDFGKLNVLADEARWILYSAEYKEIYCDRVDIDWTWLWYDEQKFKKVFMHTFAISDTADISRWIDTQIVAYKKSCIDAKYHLGNPFSLPWISWCYATIIEHNIDLQVELQDDRGLPLISRFIANKSDRFVDLALPYTLNIERSR